MTEVQIRLPDVGEGIAQAEVVQWHVAVGDRLAEDQPFVDVMTDKATVELPSPVAGVVRRLAAEVGDLVPVGAPLVWVEPEPEPGPDATSAAELDESAAANAGAVPGSPGMPPDTRPAADPRPAPAGLSPDTSPAADPRPAPAGVSPDTDTAAEPPRTPRPRAAPAVRRRAAALGIELGAVRGTGESGRVLHADLDALLGGGQAPGTGGQIPDTEVKQPSAGEPDRVERTALTGLRRNIARRMTEAHRIPHFSYVEEADVTALLRLRAQLNAATDGRPHLTVLPFVMGAVVRALGDFPELNARYDGDTETLERHSAVHLGIATQAPNGLMVPVVRHAERNDLWTNAAELRRLAAAAVDGTIRLADLSGSTITITSLGPLGGLVSTPIINAPEVAIVGINRIVQDPAGTAHGPRGRSLMNLSSSFDHRVVDGWNAASFIRRVIELLQNPALLLVPTPPPGDVA